MLFKDKKVERKELNMIDTVAISYGIQKLQNVLNGAVPMMKDLTREYIHFVVVQAILPVPIIFVMITGIVISLIVISKWCKKNQVDDEIPFGVTVIGGIILLILTVAFFICVYDMCLAIWCPEMYTIQKIIEMGK